MTEILSQFEIIAEMDILKNQWISTGGKSFWHIQIHFYLLWFQWKSIP